MSIEIKHRYTGEVIKVVDAESLINVDLSRANLDGANLVRANLDGANLVRANLVGANLYGANLYGANLYGANLVGANLYGANLVRANLVRANLVGANLTPIKNDMWVVLLQSIPEIPALKSAIKEGRIKGSTYSGECSCLAGTVAKARGVTHHDLGYTDSDRPIERFFFSIKEGDTPETSQFSKLALEWLEEFESFIAPPVAKNRAIENGEKTMTNQDETQAVEATEKEVETVSQGEASSEPAGAVDAPEGSADSAPAEEAAEAPQG